MPPDYVSVGDRYEHDRLPAQPDTVQKHDVVDLPGERRYRPKLPYPGGLPPKRRPARRKVGYRVFGKQPSEKRSQRLGAAVYFAHARGSALWASPTPRSRLRRSVALHLGAADLAFWIIHTCILSFGNFLRGKSCLNRRVKGKSDTLFETPGSWWKQLERTIHNG